jgi:Fe-S oxidoreductase
MAGSFGYEHYDISMKIGNRVLFPALRGDAAAPVAVPGFSCRHQIADGTGRLVSHPVSLLRQQLRRAERSANSAPQGEAISEFAAS